MISSEEQMTTLAFSNVFDKQLLNATLQSERIRATILAGTSAALGMTLVVLSRFDNSDFINALRQNDTEYGIFGLAAGLVIYEMFLRFVLGRVIQKEKIPPLSIRYVNALVETSVPTIAMIMFARSFEPMYALISIAPFFYFIFIVLSTLRLEFWLCAFTGFVACAEYVSLSWYYLSVAQTESLHPMLQAHVYYGVKGLLMLITGLAAGFVAIQIRRRILHSLKTLEERNAVVRMFGQHTSPEVVDELLKNQAAAGSARKYVCVMFVDIRGFTQFAERRPPEETVAFLNTIFELMIESVTKNHGIVHQLLGDGLMAIFGAPTSFENDSENAVRAAMEIIDAISKESSEGTIPPIRLGIGIHAGEGVAGTVGSALHKEYKVTGDVVNLASRIEQLNKEFGTQLLVSGEVWNSIRDNWNNGTSRGLTRIRGYEQPIEIYELVS